MQKNKKPRVIVDANVWISTLLSPTFRVRVEEILGKEYHLVFSEKLFHELNKAIRKPYFKKRIRRTDYE